MTLICFENPHRSSEQQFMQGEGLGVSIPTQNFYLSSWRWLWWFIS